MDNFSGILEIKSTPTPWDAAALGLKTYNLFVPELRPEEKSFARQRIVEILDVKESSLFYSRIDSNSILSKKVLTQCGFYNCETQLHIHKGGIKNFLAPRELGNRRVEINLALEADYSEVASVAASTFKYSRFHEDPFIKSELASKRMEMWCLDMFHNNIPLLVSRGRKGELNSFLYFKLIEADHVDLVLGGSLPGKGFLTPIFWASFLEYFQKMGIKSVSTKISASNIVIVNIYMLFGFSLKRTYFDLHKFIDVT